MLTERNAAGTFHVNAWVTELKKKLQYTDRAHTQVTVTGGGLKIEFSTGMYELFKASAEQFYSSDSLPNKCQVTPVYDESGSHVETKYKLTSGRNGLYTLNLYHTKSSCLVNPFDAKMT